MKFKTLDERYLSKRQQFSEKIGLQELWQVMDQWPLYVGLGNLSRFIAISDLLRSTLHVPGHVVEFGSWKGANLMFMAKLLRLFDPYGCKQIYCFESFSGLSTFSEKGGDVDGNSIGAYRGRYEELLDLINLHELQDDIVIHKGDIMEMLPQALKNEGLSFSFVFCDTDLYAPSRLILDSIHPRLSGGGVIIMDEWNYDQWQGEAVAVREFLKQHGDSYEMLMFKIQDNRALY